MKEKPSYYAIIPAEVRYSKKLTPNAKLLYAEITALCNMNGKCIASTEYFCRLYEVSRGAVQNWLKMLDDNGYIDRTVIYRQGSKEIMHRYINLKDKGSIKNYTDNTNINITNTNLTDSNKKAFFKKPTFDEVNNYCLERNNNIDPEAFIDFYESKNFMIGKNKMKDWKAAVRTWEKREAKKPKTMSKIDMQLNEYLKGKEYL
jgi:DNA-binding transcriptional ArsR family regulator